MAWWLQLFLIWLSIDTVIIATIWYGVATLKPNFPNWWKRVIVDIEPDYALEFQMVDTLTSSLSVTKVIR
jgi:hypothetical protein